MMLLAVVPCHQFHAFAMFQIDPQRFVAEMDPRAEALGLHRQDVVEVVPRHLPGPCPTLGIIFSEGQVEHLAVPVEVGPGLDRVILGFQRGQLAGLLPMPHAHRQQAFADHEARKNLLLHDEQVEACALQQGRGG